MSLYNIIIDLTGFSNYKKELLQSSVCNSIFLKEHEKIVIDYNDKKNKIEKFYHNYEILNIQPLKYSTESYVLDLYNKLYNNLLQQKEEELNKLNREFKENYNALVIYMKKIFYFYITKLYQTKPIRLY